MFGKKKAKAAEEAAAAAAPQQKEEKPTPAYLREDYPYQAVGEPITDLDSLTPTGVLYEIKCPECEMSFRSQGVNIKPLYNRMMIGDEVEDEDGTTRIEGGKGCIGCGNRNFIIKEVRRVKPVEEAEPEAEEQVKEK